MDSRRTTHDAPRTIYQDPANADERHDRSWVRARVLPLLHARLGEKLEKNVLRLQRSAAEERAAWGSVLRSLPGLDFRLEHGNASVACPVLQTCDKFMSVALLRAVAREAGVVVGPNRAARLAGFVIDGKSGGHLQLGDGWMAELAFGRLRIVKGSPATVPVASWGAGESGTAEWDGWEIRWRREAAGESTRRGFTAWVPVSAGEVRAPERGDRILPLGGVGSRPVRRLLMEARVPRSDRSHYPVLVLGQNVVWLPGVCRAAVDIPARGAAALRIDAHAR